MGHSHDHHHHAPVGQNEKQLFWAMALTGSFMFVELIGGLVSGSLALLSDSVHMLTDFSSLALAWFAFRISRRPADPKRTFGYHRFEVIAAFINGFTLLLIVFWIFSEAIHRLFNPHEIEGGIMIVIATIGLLVNIGSFFVLHRADQGNLNIKGAVIHVIGDLLSSAAAVIAAGIILWTQWFPIDPLLSIVVGLLILRSAWFILKRAGHILLEGTPDWLDIPEMKLHISEKIPDVLGVHHVHIWQLTSERPIVSLHIYAKEGADSHDLLYKIKEFLKHEIGIEHSTIQIEYKGDCPDHLNSEVHC
jgi:cobalt-zinc-cadmium efflux system protein